MKRKPYVPVVFFGSMLHSQTFAQICTTIMLLDELELQKHLNACLRKIVTRTLEHFLNWRCSVMSFSSLSISFHSPLIAKRSSTSYKLFFRFTALREIIFFLKMSYLNIKHLSKMAIILKEDLTSHHVNVTSDE